MTALEATTHLLNVATLRYWDLKAKAIFFATATASTPWPTPVPVEAYLQPEPAI